MQKTKENSANNSIIDIISDVNDDECCNSGCNNCVLDIRQRQLQQRINRNQNLSCNRIDVFNDGTYATFQVTSIVALNANVWRFRFQYIIDENNGDVKQQQQQQQQRAIVETSHYNLHIPPTFYLLLRAPIAAATPSSSSSTSALASRIRHDQSTADNFISRPYTPIVSDNDQLTFDILVKLQPNGLMSEYLRTLHIGQSTEWKGCFGSFEWTPNRYKYLICISQGVAIAPIHHLIGRILADDTDDTIIYSLACYRDIASILLRTEHSEYRQYWNFHSYIYLAESMQCQCPKRTNHENIDDASDKQLLLLSATCECMAKQQKFNEHIHNYRLGSQEIIDLYRKLNTTSICTVFCGVDKLEQVLLDGLNAIGDKTIMANYFKIE